MNDMVLRQIYKASRRGYNTILMRGHRIQNNPRTILEGHICLRY